MNDSQHGNGAISVAVRDPEPRRRAEQATSAERRAQRRNRIALIIQGQGLLLMALLIGMYFSATSEFFLTSDNFLQIGAASAALGVMAIAQTYLIISGGMDLSVGSVVALTNTITAITMSDGLSFWLAAPLALGVGAAVGAINALLVVGLKINPFIATLGTLSAFQGLAFAMTDGATRVVVNDVLSSIAIKRFAGLPVPLVIFLVVFVVALFVERKTGWGKTIYAIGGNQEAARLAGIKVRGSQTLLYVLSGMSGGLAGLLITAQLAAGSPQVGSTFLLSVITAVILGGASLNGGRGTVLGTLIAVGILGMLNNGFALLGWSSAAQQIALGIALIVAVLLDETTRRLRGMK